ncbi:hypothetical protein Nepgr_032199 [Nepenthes gracilis]|uniref:Uncharacterized protein n=1 Tax=Nepenthes gracilis TaxID=150966 RepID=A0AAD3TJK0_NEPGR|nr:hypothetical protein Nepgr_032199 [Nepenthes gracilis]
MAEPPKSEAQQVGLESSSRPPRPPSNLPSEPHKGGGGDRNGSYSGHKINYPNPPDPVNPDAATLRDQWRFAIRQYSRWYSHAWGTAILAGAAFFALGWIIKGSNPLASFHDDAKDQNQKQSEASASGQPHVAP